jgi:hypothetical protein
MHAIQMYYCARIAAATKKTTIGDRHCMYNKIVHAAAIADFTIDQPALLENNCKIATMGGQLSSCQKIGLSLFIACLFFWVF